MPSLLQRLGSWLCVVTALLIASTPAQGFVVCLEPDGCVSLEFADAVADCSGCDRHEDGAARSMPALGRDDDAGCPCLDLQLPGAPRAQRLLPKSLELQFVWIAPPPAARVLREQPFEPRVRLVPAGVPRPPGSLALIRSVVLLL